MKRHLKSLIQILKDHKKFKFRGAEIGTWKGYTSFGLMDAFPSCRMILVDQWMADPAYMKVNNLTQTQAAWDAMAMDVIARAEREYKGRAVVTRQPSTDAAICIAEASLDFVYIDGNHAYDTTKRDILMWWTKLKPNGVMTGHDYNGKYDRLGIWGVKRAVDEMFGSVVKIHGGHVWSVSKVECE